MQNSTSRRVAESDARSRQPVKRSGVPLDSSQELDFDDSALYNDRPLEAQAKAKRDYEATLARTPKGYGYDSDTDDTKEFKKTAERAKNMKAPEKTTSARKERAEAETPRAKSSRTEKTSARSNGNTDNVKAISSLKLSNPQDRSDTRKQAPSTSRSGAASSNGSTGNSRQTTSTSRTKPHETRDPASQRTQSGFKILPGRHYTLEKYPMDHQDAERRGKTRYVCLVSRRCKDLRIDLLKDVEKHLRDSHYEALWGVREEREKPKVREVAGSGSGKSVGGSSSSAGKR